MSEELLIQHCSPTLAGIKTGNLFSCPCTSKAEIMEDVRQLNRRLARKGLCIMPLKITEGRALLYLFRPDRLKKDLTDVEALRILQEAGYKNVSRCGCLTTLKRRLSECSDFPHEIGLFLSYPPRTSAASSRTTPATSNAPASGRSTATPTPPAGPSTAMPAAPPPTAATTAAASPSSPWLFLRNENPAHAHADSPYFRSLWSQKKSCSHS